ncbi:MAG: hypothetical protein IPM18_12080 [Phycisphaerales bacterium]|nr:hypothetical protein [Phycisphaerales bacterium]
MHTFEVASAGSGQILNRPPVSGRGRFSGGSFWWVSYIWRWCNFNFCRFKVQQWQQGVHCLKSAVKLAPKVPPTQPSRRAGQARNGTLDTGKRWQHHASRWRVYKHRDHWTDGASKISAHRERGTHYRGGHVCNIVSPKHQRWFHPSFGGEIVPYFAQRVEGVQRRAPDCSNCFHWCEPQSHTARRRVHSRRQRGWRGGRELPAAQKYSILATDCQHKKTRPR